MHFQYTQEELRYYNHRKAEQYAIKENNQEQNKSSWKRTSMLTVKAEFVFKENNQEQNKSSWKRTSMLIVKAEFVKHNKWIRICP